MTRKYRWAMVAMAFAGLHALDASANPVFVRATGAFGRGLTRTRGGQCFVMTAEHVVHAPGPIRVIAFGGASADATVPYADNMHDIAILAIADPKGAICDDADWPQPSSLNSVIRDADTGSLQLPTEDGKVTVKVVLITEKGPRLVKVKARSDAPSERLILGHSGSVFVVNNIPVGMLLGIDTNTGEGTVARFDYVSGLIAGFFDPSARFAIDPVKMQAAISRVLAAATDDFDAIKGGYDSRLDSDTSLYNPSVLLPGAKRGTLFRSAARAFIVWDYPTLDSETDGAALYEALSRSLQAAVPKNWTADRFKNGSKFITKLKTTAPGPAGPIIEMELKEGSSGYDVSVTAYPLDTDKLIDIDRENVTQKRAGVDFNYKITNVSDVTVDVELTIKGLERRRGASDAKESTCGGRKEFKFRLGPRKEYRAKGTVNCEYDEEYIRSLRPETDVTIVK